MEELCAPSEDDSDEERDGIEMSEKVAKLPILVQCEYMSTKELK